MTVLGNDICESLLFLLKASAKDQVAKTCELAFDCIIGSASLNDAISSECLPPDTTKEEREKLLSSLAELYEKALGQDSTGIANVFPADFHRQLRDLLIRIILQRQQDWSSKITKARAGIPWLRSFSCCAIEAGQQQPSLVAINVEVGSGAPTDTPRFLSMTVNPTNLANVTGKMRQLADQLESIANR